MGDIHEGISGRGSGFADARRLLDEAVVEAGRIRSEAESAARQREYEAELLLAKARRVLVAAEQKAAVIVATAEERAARADGRVVDITDDIGRVIAPGATRIPSASHTTRLDRLLASAINSAVSDAFPVAETG